MSAAAPWTTDQILALAPDDSSAKAGRTLASSSKWVTLGCDTRAVWGECQGSGSQPYQVQIDLSEPVFRCSCPSRKFPCKHGIALFLLYASSHADFASNTAPGWVTDWIGKREQTAQKKQEKSAEPRTEEQAAKTAADQAKRAASREKRVAEGMDQLDIWMQDLARHGLASVASRPYSYWSEPAARLVDAQAPGVARRLQDLSGLPHSGAGWTDRMLERLGLLYLLVEGSRRLASLPEPVREDVRTAVGWAAKQEDVLSQEGVRGDWSVLGQHSHDEDQFRVVRTWLREQETGRLALLLAFTRQGQTSEAPPLPGSVLPAELVYFPSAYPLRAVIKQRLGSPRPIQTFEGHGTVRGCLDAYANALASNPWIETFPAPLSAVVPVQRGGGWLLADETGEALPLADGFKQPWKLMALSGGRPFAVFGEWDGARLEPLSAWADGRYHGF
jgi:uncharacterized Zn finger protein